jgi:dihydrofolate reductase
MASVLLDGGDWGTVKQRFDACSFKSVLQHIKTNNANSAARINMPSIAYIIARTESGVIGCNNALPWHLKTDLKRFKSITLNHVVIMGRKTYDSIGHALPLRKNVVISRDPSFSPKDAEVFSTFADAILYADVFSLSAGLDTIFVVGGAVIFEKMRVFVDTAYVTEIHTSEIKGDAEFNYKFESKEWALERKEVVPKSDIDEYDSTFFVYKRRKTVLRKRGIREFLTDAA